MTNNIKRPAAIIAVLAAAGVVASFANTMVVPIQPILPELLGASRGDTAWVVTAALLAATVTAPISGRLGDMYGKRRVILGLLVALVAGSAVAAMSSGVLSLIVGRVLQGASLGVVPLGIAIIHEAIDKRRVDSASVVVSAAMGIGAAIGMPMSALITQHFDWHTIFWVSAGLGLIVFLMVLGLVPAAVTPVRGRFDLLGAVGLAVTLTGILVAISRGGEWGWVSPATLATGLGGGCGLALWSLYQLRKAEPLLDLRLAVRRPIVLTNLASVALGFALFSSNVAFPQLLGLPQPYGLGVSLWVATMVVAPSGLIMMAAAPLSTRIAIAAGPKVLLILGALAIAGAYGFLLLSASEVWHVLVATLLVGLGSGFSFGAMPLLIMRAVPHNETGESNGINVLFRTLGTSISGAAIGAVLAIEPVRIDGRSVPEDDTFALAFLVACIVAVVAAILAFFIPQGYFPSPRAPRPVRNRKIYERTRYDKAGTERDRTHGRRARTTN